MPHTFMLTRAVARVFAFGAILVSATACTTAPRPALPVIQDEKPEPLSPDIKPLTVEQAEQVLGQ